MFGRLKRFVRDDEAPTAVEYALMLACIAVVLLAGAFLLGQNTNSRLEGVAAGISNPSTATGGH